MSQTFPNHIEQDEEDAARVKNPAAVVLGSIRSERKAAASRKNGKLGGYPKGRKRKPVENPPENPAT